MKVRSNKILCFGEVLWDRLPSGAKPGGAPMNVALHLNAIGKDAVIASRIGADQPGEELKVFLKQSGLSCELIQLDDELPTSEVLVHLDEKNNASYEICEPVAWDNIERTTLLEEAANQAGLLIFGSLASRNETTRNTLMSLLQPGILKLIDVNLRNPYDRKELVEPLLQKADIIKLNDDELKVFANWFDQLHLNEEELLTWLAQRYGTQLICVTKGADGATLWAEGDCYQHPGYRVETVDTVGAGDAFLAGLVSALLDGEDYPTALAFACATGAFVASKSGATPAYDLDEVRSLMTS